VALSFKTLLVLISFALRSLLRASSISLGDGKERWIERVKKRCFFYTSLLSCARFCAPCQKTFAFKKPSVLSSLQKTEFYQKKRRSVFCQKALLFEAPAPLVLQKTKGFLRRCEKKISKIIKKNLAALLRRACRSRSEGSALRFFLKEDRRRFFEKRALLHRFLALRSCKKTFGFLKGKECKRRAMD
jgi:hypothetical protein